MQKMQPSPSPALSPVLFLVNVLKKGISLQPSPSCSSVRSSGVTMSDSAPAG